MWSKLVSIHLRRTIGAFFVVLQTVFSGISELPFNTFVILMQPIHLAIGFVEGLTTAAVVIFVWKSRPEILQPVLSSQTDSKPSIQKVLIGFVIATVVFGGALSWFASAHPDGLEWAMFKTAGVEELEAPEKGIHSSLANIQEKTAFLPDYGFKKTGMHDSDEGGDIWPAVDPGTSVSGFVGGLLTLLMAGFIGFILKRRKAANA